MHSVLKVAGVVHIWYYIPLCTIFSQQFNGGIFRTNFHSSKSRSQNPMPILEGGFFNSSVWQSMAAIRRPFKNPNHLALQELGWQFHSGLFQGHSQRLYSLSISCQGIKYFNNPWTTQLIHKGFNQATCMSLAQLGQFNLPLWELNHTVYFQDGQNCIEPIQTIQPVIHFP
ncbi:hypothetical protein O181_129553 [Austropuccinia psidii MF-1]|uniref:Uncharacterized protein n=1 Tax=Austropuccinia psidii MF-1 TaxID=1389203 RepID=A0A9Q3KYD1_9BASI|nr:hypothetical protein [Austropuccinia psidii MF-1]